MILADRIGRAFLGASFALICVFGTPQALGVEQNDGNWGAIQNAFQNQDYFGALTQLRALEKVSPDDPRVHWALFTILEQVGAFEAARVNLRRHFELIGRLDDAGYVSHDTRLERSVLAKADKKGDYQKHMASIATFAEMDPAQALTLLEALGDQIGWLTDAQLDDYYLQYQLLGQAAEAVKYAHLDYAMRSAPKTQALAKQRLQRCENDSILARELEARVPIEGGLYRLGTTRKAWRKNGKRDIDLDERPAHKVTLTPFSISAREVTVAEYRHCQIHYGCPAPVLSTTYHSAQQPMVGLNWEGAELYCRSRSGRLPTEAEWEAAARGKAERRYPWGDDAPTCDLATFRGCVTVVGEHRYESSSLPVGLHPEGATPEGVFDLAGNVAEWVGDFYHKDGYASLEKVDPLYAKRSKRKVTRGGGFDRSDWELRGARREGRVPSQGYADVGFRCVWPMSDGE